jgi:hypothetical protein
VTLDLEQVLREIDEEVAAKRASGALPPELERELDLAFAKYVPDGAGGDDMAGMVAAVARNAFIDPDPVTGSNIPLVGYLKQGERKLLGWYFRHLAQQVTAFGSATVEAFEVLGRRVDALTQATAGAAGSADAEARAAAPAPQPEAVAAAVAALAGTSGRVLLAESGDGAVLRDLVDAGMDAYGVDPAVDAVVAAGALGLDVVDGDAVAHLRALAPGCLGGILLVGGTDRSTAGARVELAAAAASALAPGGRLAIVGRDPARWGADNPAEADLAAGRPFAPATWVHLCGRQALTGAEAQEGDGWYVVTATRPR